MTVSHQKSENTWPELKSTCKELRALILEMLTRAGSGHPGGSLSAVEILAMLYFGGILKYDPKNPNSKERDIFILSKGHGCPVLYACLALAGYFPKEKLWTLRKIDSLLQGHPDRLKTPGVEASCGSLGQGLSMAQGAALAFKMDHSKRRVYCLAGDGEIQEGQVWETAMSAPKFQLDNLTVIIDYNKIQLDGPVKEIMDLEPMADKWKAFRWEVFEIDGHNLYELKNTFEMCLRVKNKPQLIIAHTIKGKGVSFMENSVEWHGKAPSREETEKALHEISASAATR